MDAPHFKKGVTYNEDQIYSLINKKARPMSEIEFKWILFDLLKNNILTKIGTKKYIADGKKYSYEYTSKCAKAISRYLANSYPLIKSIVWETSQLNEWSNLLLTKNIIFVEVEPGELEILFDKISEKFGCNKIVLLNPTYKEIERYMRNDLIVVKTLYSKSPIDKKNRKIKIEKLIVDLGTDNVLTNMFDSTATNEMIKSIASSYDINMEQVYTYASRKRCLNIMKELIDGEY